jgi:ribosomal protein S12 methylthiotransferase accessory factor
MASRDFDNILSSLEEWGITPTIQKLSEFYDEPKFFGYNAHLKIHKKLRRDYQVGREISAGTGLSTSSKEEAFYKCIFEAIERFCLECYKKKSVLEARQMDSKEFIDLSAFSKDPDIKTKKVGWIEGRDLLSGKKKFLPMQLVHYIYKRKKNEPRLDYPLISTGAAAGKTNKQAILNGIYEVVERDSLMCAYLPKITPPRVDLKDINNPVIDYILEACAKYNIEIHVVDATTNLKIPAFIAVMIDKTGVGPAVALGAKSSLRTVNAIIGAITECLLVRVSTRLKALRNDLVLAENMDGKDAVLKRAAFWFDTSMIKNINFLISGHYIKVDKKDYQNTDDELVELLNIVKKSNLKPYYIDIAFEGLEKLGVYVCKIIIPGLQPLFLNEWEKDHVINRKRLEEASNYFGVAFKEVNSIPHPFL